jgi:D-serine deaminase-like pyridoxal phosphate-dependent protein
VDGGIGRTGISAHQVIDFANKLQSMRFLNLRGIQCYAGHLQHVSHYQQRKQASLATMQQAAVCLDALKAQGFAVDILTGGGTGTYDIDVEVPGVTEIQPGSYVVMDVEYQAISSKQATTFSTFKPALTLLGAVVSVNQADYVTVDAGTKAIYVDNHHFPQIISHKGLTFDWAGFGDEHGKVKVSPKAQKPVLGEYVEMIVPHCDPTINLYENYYLMEKDVVIDVIPIDLRGH